MGPIHGDRQIQLSINVDCRRYQKPLDFKTFGTGLYRNHLVGQHECGRFLDGLHRIHHLHKSSLATSTSMNLSLDHDLLVALSKDVLGSLDRLLDGFSDLSLRDGDAGLSKKLSGLILVDLHGLLPSR